MSNFSQELEWLLKAKTKCIWIQSYEEQQVINDIKNVILNSFPTFKLISWSFFTGYQKEPLTNKEIKEAPNNGFPPDMLFQEIIDRQKEGSISLNKSGKKEVINKNENIYIIKDFHSINSEKQLIRAVRDTKERTPKEMLSYNPIIVISPVIELPLEHDKLFTVLKYKTPSKEQISVIFNNFVKMMDDSDKYKTPDKDNINSCIELSQGLTIEEVKHYCARSLAQYNTLSDKMFYTARLDLINKTGILEYKKADSNITDMGGNHAFKEWISEIKDSYSEEAINFGVEKSKGFLALGLPGTAKSLAAEMISKELNLPLLKFNMSSIMHSHVGKSEQNMANAIEIIKKCSPCVLFIDEVEKTLAGSTSDQSDGGTVMRVTGMLLELMSSKDAEAIFTIMTSNDVSKLPPELSRSGRLDTLWYFGMPSLEERIEIFKIHFGKTKAIISEDIIYYAASLTKNLTGAEIKECVKVSIRKAFKRYKEDGIPNISEEDINLTIPEIIPIYESSKEKILNLEYYAKDRARFAHVQDEPISINSDTGIMFDYDEISDL